MSLACCYRWLHCLFFIFLTTTAYAQNNYHAWVEDIENRLDKTATLYQQNNVDEARTEVQMAYFEVFENLEGPIRINFSAQKSYQMEATFGEIRKMIGEGRPQAEVQSKIDALKKELQEVLPALGDGHQLNAEGQHATYDNQDIAIHWQQSFKVIDDLLAQAISAYQNQAFTDAKKLIQQAQYDGFKNSEMEMSIRQNRAASISADINQQFYDLIKLSEQPGQINAMGYQITTLLQTIEEQLPQLPTTRDSQTASSEAQAVVENQPDVDWNKIVTDINQRLQQAIQIYQTGETKKAILAVQDTYFDIFEASGMENKIGSRDAEFKSRLEGYFTRLVGLMKANESSDKLHQQTEGLAQELQKATNMLQGESQSDWQMFIYSLLIILREGLEALLIVAAIVTYLIKNNHQDKLPVIRQSVYVALVASIATAVIFQLVFTANSGENRELLEGFTMMFAVVMLFMMSYWLLSKVEAENWKRYLEGKLSTALTTGSLIGLWLTSFLAVYREGAETVLFYYALVSDAKSAVSFLYLFAGFVIGALALVVCYFIMRYSVVKLPLKPFFMFTGSFMYLMAFVFAGKSVLELIEGKLFEPTLLSGFPEISWLGIYPYVETLTPQIVLLIAALFAWLYMKYQGKNHATTN